MATPAINIRRAVALSGINTGPDALDFNPLNILGEILVPVGTVITDAQMGQTAFLSLLSTNFAIANKLQRWFPMWPHLGFESSNPSDQRETFDYTGTSRRVRRGELSWTFRMDAKQNLSERQNKLVDQSQGRLAPFWVVATDSLQGGYAIVGKQLQTAAGVPSLVPHRMSDISYMTPQWPTGSTTIDRKVMYTFMDPNALNQELGFIFLDVNPLETVPGLIDIILTIKPGTTSGHILARAIGGVTNMLDNYSTQLQTTALWKVTNADTGANISVSAVTTGADGYLDLTTAAATGTRVFVELVDTAALATANIVGFESDRKGPIALS